ncbi:MAG TPA: transglycosylase, partial [Aminobacterium sp.]|nr:transglycosylase [Aminobacterium sp.]
QLMPATGQEEARLLEMGNADLWDPATNILLGASHLARLQKRFRRLEWAVAAYNAGSGSVGKWIKEGEDRPFDEWMEDIPYNETRNYVRKVMGNLFIYRVLY